jgi:hypothetical protein
MWLIGNVERTAFEILKPSEPTFMLFLRRIVAPSLSYGQKTQNPLVKERKRKPFNLGKQVL